MAFIEKYLLPYFGNRCLKNLRHKDIADFELWRNRQMTKKPKAISIHNFASAWNQLNKIEIDKVNSLGEDNTVNFTVTYS